MLVNLRNIFPRMQPTQQDIQTLHGVDHGARRKAARARRAAACSTARRPRLLRTLLAEHGDGRVPGERGPVRGLARLLRRNPTEAERALWDALTKDRRFAGQGFKRQTPVGPHITDFVSFPLRMVIDLVPAERERSGRQGARRAARLARRARLSRDRVEVRQWTDLSQVLDRLAHAVGEAASEADRSA